MMRQILASIFLAICLVLDAQGQPVAARPEYKVGDKWTYNSVDAVAGTTKETSREIREIGPANRIVALYENGSTQEYDLDMNLAPTGAADARLLVRYPLKVGDSWTFTAKFSATSNVRENGSVKVVAYESLTVPAGTFDCYRIDAEGTAAAGAYRAYRRWSRWYCPAIKWFAKEHMQANVFSPFNGGTTNEDWTAELIVYSPGQ